jgi:tRNA threonylcarbamoyladenosine biosynthesis protein TsaB
MASNIILIIDTALEIGRVVLVRDNAIIYSETNPNPLSYSSWIHPAIKKALHETKIKIQQISAISVTEGPGSYTGIRIGLSTTKGLCYATNIPLIVLNTLELIAMANKNIEATLYVPMIDARRNDVFTAILNTKMDFVKEPFALSLQDESFLDNLNSAKIVFCGTGATKFKNYCLHPNAIFRLQNYNEFTLMNLSINKLAFQKFTNAKYVLPNYAKAFFSV